MLPPVAVGAVIYACMLVILCIGFSLTHMMEKFPNFAHADYAGIGTMFAYTFVRLWGHNPYLAWPFAFLLGGGLGMALYLLVVRPIRRAGSGGIMLTFATLALSRVLATVLAIYSYWVLMTYRFRTGRFMLRGYDLSWMGYPVILFAAPLTGVVLVVSIHLFLTRVKFGIAMRATAEDPELSVSLGVNIFRVHLVSWFLTGGMSALAGAVLPLWLPTRLGGSDELLMSVIAGSVIGGLDNIYGAIIGGFTMALATKVLPGLLIRAFGLWIGGYEPMVSILVIVTILLLEPKGITGILNREHTSLRKVRRTLGRLLASPTG